MSLFVYIKQILGVYVCVLLGSGKAGVTQKLLNGAKIAAPLEQMGGVGVPERMCAGLGANVRSKQAPGNDSADGSIR